MTGPDRRVHACLDGVAEVVRYDRAGAWYVEYAEGDRARVSLTEAARVARNLLDRGGKHYSGKIGGSAFDRRLASVIEADQ